MRASPQTSSLSMSPRQAGCMGRVTAWCSVALATPKPGWSRSRSRAPAKGRPGTHVFKKVRTQGTSWKHLFLLGRPRTDAGRIRAWRHASDFQDTMWLGYVTHHDFDAALRWARLADRDEVDVTLTPGSSRARSWLADSVKWIRLNALTCQWWRENISCAD
mmetsp:Transcript_4564/g.10721  ORF Transcript_4564/g.10721 Transcript_4564/m.10721 type:complete len:161 (+) Transcript_4564:223-705(+)